MGDACADLPRERKDQSEIQDWRTEPVEELDPTKEGRSSHDRNDEAQAKPTSVDFFESRPNVFESDSPVDG